MKYATVCSGIGAPEVAWMDMWGRPVFTSEIEKFPLAVLKHHMPDVPNYGDMTKYKEWPDHDIGLICGGTPCQAFSVAGLRKGMDDPRGNLTLAFLGLIARYNPRWIVWENVPGVLSSVSNGQSDFGRFLTGLAKLGYSCAYRILDAQYFGVPQRRRRVFVVGHLGADWRPPYAVLFEPESMRGNTPKGRKAGESVTALTSTGVGTCGADDNQAQGGHLIPTHRIAPCIQERGGKGADSDCTQAHVIHIRQDPITSEKALPLESKGGEQAVAFNVYSGSKRKDRPEGGMYVKDESKSKTLDANTGLNPSANQGGTIIKTNTIVRRLTPMECERLQGFPDGYTLIPGKYKFKSDIHHAVIGFLVDHFNMTEHEAHALAGHPDGPRYKALGNSMAVPVLKWIGERIELWESLISEGKITP